MGKPDPNASDWSDLDLLTIAEASERLDAEIAATTARLGELPDGPQRAQAAHRLELLTRVREQYGETS